VPNLITVIKLSLLYHIMADSLFTCLRRSLQDEIHKAEQKVVQSKLADEDVHKIKEECV